MSMEQQNVAGQGRGLVGLIDMMKLGLDQFSLTYFMNRLARQKYRA